MKGLLKNNFIGVIENLKLLFPLAIIFGIIVSITGNASLLSIYSLSITPILLLLVVLCMRKETLSKWDKYKISLPVRRNDIVKSYYTIHLCWCIGGMAIVTFFMFLTVIIHGNQYFYYGLRVSDNGVGMNQHIIDNYYTNVGCSYYSSREFSELMVSFKSSFTPISRFGIGILSCFMVCDSMEVTTRRIRERFECDEALHISIEGYESLFVISDSNKKEPGTDTILTLRPVHPWDRMNEEEFMQCIKGIVPNPAVQIEIETNKGSELYSSDYFDDLDLKPLLDYSWNNIKNIRKIDIDLTCEAYGFKGKGCIGILIKNGLPAEEIEILSKDVEIDGEIYTLSSNIKYKTNCITETSTSISVDEDGEIDTNTSWSERFKSKASLSIHGIEVPYNLFPDYSNGMSKAALKIPFPFSFRLDIGVNSDLNLNSARDQIIYDEKWLTFEENLYRIICRRLKDTLSSSDWKILNEIIQKNNTDTFSRVANSFE